MEHFQRTENLIGKEDGIDDSYREIYGYLMHYQGLSNQSVMEETGLTKRISRINRMCIEKDAA